MSVMKVIVDQTPIKDEEAVYTLQHPGTFNGTNIQQSTIVAQSPGVYDSIARYIIELFTKQSYIKKTPPTNMMAWVNNVYGLNLNPALCSMHPLYPDSSVIAIFSEEYEESDYIVTNYPLGEVNTVLFILPDKIQYNSFARSERLRILAQMLSIICDFKQQSEFFIMKTKVFNMQRQNNPVFKIGRYAPLIILSLVYQQIDKNALDCQLKDYKDAFTSDADIRKLSDDALIACKNFTISELLDRGRIIPILDSYGR